MPSNVRFPDELWPDPEDAAVARQVADAFTDQAVLLTDQLANVVFLTAPAETMLGDRAEALVNRLSLSLLGFGNTDRVPAELLAALAGQREPWKGLVNLGMFREGGQWHVAEASAARRGSRFVCGIVRIGREQAIHQSAGD